MVLKWFWSQPVCEPADFHQCCFLVIPHTHRSRFQIMKARQPGSCHSNIFVLFSSFHHRTCADAKPGLFIRALHKQLPSGDRVGRERPDRGPREQVPLSSVCAWDAQGHSPSSLQCFSLRPGWEDAAAKGVLGGGTQQFLMEQNSKKYYACRAPQQQQTQICSAKVPRPCTAVE